MKIASAPRIEGLTIKSVLDWAKQKPELMKYLPEDEQWHHGIHKLTCKAISNDIATEAKLARTTPDTRSKTGI